MSGMTEPHRDCPRCPRLATFRTANRAAFPDFHNGPAPGFGDRRARLLVVGLAPGLKGANRTGRPFTGDYAGDLLYATLARFGFSNDRFDARIDDGLELFECRITNAVRCVPPQNKPVGAEIAACRPFLRDEIAALARLEVIVALGGLAHGAVLAALGQRRSAFAFAHGAQHVLDRDGASLVLADSYHCSRYNTNTGRLTPQMFEAVFAEVRNLLDRRNA
jgi:uracil-DNA glycosylase family 4